MTLAIVGLGTSVPARFVTQQRAAEITSQIAGHGLQQTRRLATLYRRTGIHKRHAVLLERPNTLASPSHQRGPTTRRRMLLYDRLVRPLAYDAARKALLSAELSAREITHLITVSCTGFAAPGFDLALVDALGLDPSVQRTHVGFMGCHGALNGLRLARAYTTSDHRARVLLCCAELCSLHFQFGSDADSALPNALFGDGAAALVGVPDTGSGGNVWRLVANGSHVVPRTQNAITWHIGNHGFQMMLSPRVPGRIIESLRPWLETWLESHGVTIASVRSWAVHPGGPRVLDAVEEALGLDREATSVSREVLSACGNMSSPTILFIVERLRARCAPLPCVALAFGPGMTIEATLFA